MFAQNDPLVISTLIGNKNVHPILVDTGSAVDILYEETFNRMGLKERLAHSLSREPLWIYRWLDPA